MPLEAAGRLVRGEVVVLGSPHRCQGDFGVKFTSGGFADVSHVTASFIEGRIKSAAIVRQPFPHIYVPNILPSELYASMLASLPSESQWSEADPIAPHFNVIGTGATPQILLDHARLWTENYGGYIDLINRLLSERFADDIDGLLTRYRKLGLIDGPRALFTGQSLFCLRPSGWEIRPHSHNINELVQSLIYFPLPESPATLGTTLYKVTRHTKVERKNMNRDLPYAPHSVERVQKTRYEPNALFSFLNSPMAVHAAEGTASMPDRRYIFTKVIKPVESLDHKRGSLSTKAFDTNSLSLFQSARRWWAAAAKLP